jgi:hypothetical protein
VKGGVPKVSSVLPRFSLFSHLAVSPLFCSSFYFWKEGSIGDSSVALSLLCLTFQTESSRKICVCVCMCVCVYVCMCVCVRVCFPPQVYLTKEKDWKLKLPHGADQGSVLCLNS